ncbi:MAG: GntR family transcriptional regulator, partial [Planctomycetota bacterium]
MFGLAIDPNGGDSLVDQLAEGLIARIADGRLAPGERLPSSRTLADALGIHRNTVTAAFRRLGEDGWLESQVGRGTFVAESLPRVAPVPEQGTGPRFDWASYQPRRGRTPGEEMASAYDSPQHPDTISFAGGVPDPALYPADEVRKLCRELLRGDDTLLFRYGPAAGYEPLRELVRQEAARDGVASESFEVLITNGSSQGLDLFLRFACEPGATVVATSP